MPPTQPRITIHEVTMAYGSFVIQHDLTFSIQPGEIFIIMGGSGCGKSTLLRHFIGLMAPAHGEILYDRASFWSAPPADRERMKQRFGVLSIVSGTNFAYAFCACFACQNRGFGQVALRFWERFWGSQKHIFWFPPGWRDHIASFRPL